MPGAAVELYNSRRQRIAGLQSSETRNYYTFEHANEEAARVFVQALAPPTVTVDGLVLSELQIDIDPIDGIGKFFATAEYTHAESNQNENNNPPLQDEDDIEYSFRSSGVTINLKEAIFQDGYGPSPLTEIGKLIGVGLDGEVKGVDIIVPHMELNVKKVFPASTATNAWLITRAQMVGTINDDTFLGFNEKELLLTEVSKTQKAKDSLVTVSYSFIYEPTRTLTPTLKTVSTNVPKAGHDYVWFYPERYEATTDKILAERLHSAYVAGVYYTNDFGDLEIE